MSGRRGKHEEEHENHERWLVSYADMITVLMALFIVLFAMSQVDVQKFNKLAMGLQDGFGSQSPIPVEGGTGMMEADGVTPMPNMLRQRAEPQPLDIMGTGADDENDGKERSAALLKAAQAELARLRAVQAQMQQSLDDKGFKDRVRFRVNERGLVAAIVADDIVFESASSELKPKGQEIIRAVAGVLGEIPDNVVAEGHANHLPLNGKGLMPTNWELSTLRAGTVVRFILDESAVVPERIHAAGFGSTRPLYPIEDPQAIAGNRRVDVVVLSGQTVGVRALLPQLARTQDGQDAPVEATGEPGSGTEGGAEVIDLSEHPDTQAAAQRRNLEVPVQR